MGYRKTSFALDEFYHVYNRGNSKQTIFKDVHDYVRFQELLYLVNSSDPVSVKDARKKKGGVYSAPRGVQLVSIGAYALMPNHFHILLTPLVDDGVSIFMKKLATGYVMYFNKKYDRTGGLFENRFKSSYIDTDEYLKYMYAYIHLNIAAVKHKQTFERNIFSDHILQHASAYRFSSLQDYVSENREESSILTKNDFPDFFESEKNIHIDLLDWIRYEKTNEL